MKRTEIKRKTRLRSISEKQATQPKPAPASRAWINRTTTQRKGRKPKETTRAHGSEEFRKWIKSLPCAFCGVVGYSDAAHVRNGGVGRKADCRFLVPACRNVPVFEYRGAGHYVADVIRPGCHHDFDQHKKSWREQYGTDAMADTYAAAWQAELTRRTG